MPQYLGRRRPGRCKKVDSSGVQGVLSAIACLRQSSRNACPVRRKVLDMKRVPIAICCLVLIAVLVGCTHDHQFSYATRSDAEKKGEFDRRWLPDFLPKSSRSIHLTYDLSPSRECCGFEFNREDAEPLLSSVKPADLRCQSCGFQAPACVGGRKPLKAISM
jgi:hypothetical protein